MKEQLEGGNGKGEPQKPKDNKFGNQKGSPIKETGKGGKGNQQ